MKSDDAQEGTPFLRAHRKLDVWKESISLVVSVYELTKNFPKDEQYSLTQQIRRSAVSIPSNVAEGAARTSKKEFLHSLNIAAGSISELETQLIIAERLNYAGDTTIVFQHLDKVSRLLNGLIKYLKGK